jgi:histidine triad (HIT) family protein
MNECIFCKIVRKEIPSYIFYEDEKCVAFLDIKPRTKGMTIIVPRIHYESFDFDLQTSFHCLKISLEIAKALKNVLETKDVEIAVIKSPQNHFNIRIYPFFDTNAIFEKKPEEISELELNRIWQKLKGIKIEIEEKKEERTIEKKEVKSFEELYRKWAKKFLP